MTMSAVTAPSVHSYVRRMPKDRQAPPRRPPPHRIKHLLRERAITQRALAEKWGHPPSTISRVITGEIELSRKWRRRFAAELKVSEGELFDAPPLAGLRVPVKGELRAGYWAASHEWPEDEQYDVMIPDEARLRYLQLYAGVVRGTSMDLRYPDGSIVVMSRVGPGDVRPGRRYHVRRTRADGEVEETIKTLTRDAQGRLWLRPESSDPAHQAWIPLDGDPEATVELVGWVCYAIHREE